jgi:putative ABC transport system substrate-binding protein
MNRRDAMLALLSLGAGSRLVIAQPGPARLALIASGAAEGGAATLAALRAGLRDNGLTEGKDYVLDPFWADGHYDRFPKLVEAALGRKPSIILVATIASARAAQQATKTVPIVMMGLNDPVGSGLVASLARPGGNTTGIATMFDDLAVKLVEFVRETMPKAKRLAVLINPQNASNRPISQTVQKAAASAGMMADAYEADAPERIDGAFAALSKTRPDALLTGFDSMLFENRAQIVSFAMAHKIPVFGLTSAFTDAGALVSYGVSSYFLITRQVAAIVKKILAGKKTAELPVEQPTNFELVINLKTAKALGLTIPPSFVQRADRVIE